ncbi:MAG: tetratricopeptide repeat protein [Planctomycetota bacterium]|nr:tetratricopeptide repeat protein [Planctomycetota bacterium]
MHSNLVLWYIRPHFMLRRETSLLGTGRPQMIFMRLTYFALVGTTLSCGCRLLPCQRRSDDDLVISRQHTQRGLSELRSGRAEDAEQRFVEAIRACPHDPMARRLYADALWQRGAESEAIAQVRECIRLSGALDVGQVVRLGEMYLKRGDLLRAEEQAQEAIRLANDDAAGWILRARTRSAQGKLELALADLQRALSHNPDNVDVRLEIVEHYTALNRPERGLAILHALTEKTPEQDLAPRVAILEGTALQRLGRHDEAIDAFARAQQRGGSPGDLLLRSADSYLALGMSDQARWAADAAERVSASVDSVREIRGRIARQSPPTDGAATLQR